MTRGHRVEAPIFFASPEEFRRWLEANHDSAELLWVGFHKRGTGKPSLTWPESVDQALCFGWIDGDRKSLDGERYVIRFTPRKATSKWSRINVARMAELEAAGLVRPAGRTAFRRKPEGERGTYSYELRDRGQLGPELEQKFRAKKRAWAFYETQPPGYRRLTAFWVVSAKRAETRERRLATLIECSAAGRRIPGLEREKSSKR